MKVLKWTTRKIYLSTLFDSVEKAVKQWNATNREGQLKTVKAQLRYLGAMCYLHTMWAEAAKDAETIRQHREIVDSLQQFQKQLIQFLDSHAS